MNKLLLKLAAPVLMTSVLLTSMQVSVVNAEEVQSRAQNQTCAYFAF